MKRTFFKRLLLLVAGRTIYVWNGPRGVLVALALAISGAPASLVVQIVFLLILSAVMYVGEEQDRFMRFIGIGHAAVHALLWVAGAGIVTSVVNAIHGAPGWAVLGAGIPADIIDTLEILAKLVANLALLGYMASAIIFLFTLTARGIKIFYDKRLI